MNAKKLLKWLMYLILTTLLALILLISFYVWMIYGIHPSDEGTRSVACEYDDKQKKYTPIVVTTIIDQKRVKTKGNASHCAPDLR